jgi:adenylate cyclase
VLWKWTSSGQAKEGLEMVFKAMCLNPHYPEWYVMQLDQIFFDARQYLDAISTFRRLRRLHTPVVELYLAASRAALGNLDQARTAINSAITLDPHASIAKCTGVDMASYKNEEDRKHFIENLRLAGLPE